MEVLPAPVGPTSATVCPGAMARFDVVQHFGQSAAVAEGHVLAARPAPRSGGISTASGRSAHRGRGVQQFEHLLAAGHGRLHGGVQRLSSWMGWKKRVT